MKQRVYIETTVVSYLCARPSRDLVIAGHQESTRSAWELFLTHFETYISVMVLQEAGRGETTLARKRMESLKPFPILKIDDEARMLAEKLISANGIPKECPEDALHIAVAAVNGMDLIATQNFAHLNNPFTKNKIRTIIENSGYIAPEICSPEELAEGER